MEKEELKAHLKARDTWLRVFYVIVFAVIFSIADTVLAAVVVFQFLSRLLTGAVNERLQVFGQQLSTYLYQMLIYFTFNSDERPYPFAAWPKGAPGAGEEKPPKRPAPRKKATARKKAAPPAAPDASTPGADEAQGGGDGDTPNAQDT